MTSDPRIDRLEGLTEQMTQRLNNIVNRLTSLESRMTNMWGATMGTMIAGFITMFVAILLTR
jgi:hypothetical protein